MRLNEIIKNYRSEHKITMQDFANMCGLSKGYISMLESGKNPRSGKPISPNIDNLAKLASGLGLELDELIQRLGDDEKVSLSPGAEPSNVVELPREFVRSIPVYESASAGFGVEANPIVTDYIPLYIISESEARETICVTVTGDSMYPKIEDGDTIQVRKQTSVDSGSIAVVLVDGEEALVKRVVYGDDWIELQSINPEYITRKFTGEDVQRIQVVGLVRKIIKTV